MAHDIDEAGAARTGAAFQIFGVMASMLLWVLFSFLPIIMPSAITSLRNALVPNKI